MNCLAIVGFVCLGLFVGLLVGWFVNSEREPDSKGYSAVIVAAGGAAAGFVPFFSPMAGRELMFYPIALLAGLLIAPVFDVLYDWLYGLEAVKRINARARADLKFNRLQKKYSPE
jgi:hypothetical protein